MRWVCKDGRRMLIAEMADSHLANAIAMVERSKTAWRFQSLPRLYLERGLRKLKRRRNGSHESRQQEGG